ncbi:MAG TPA: nitroreductase family protein [Thermoleophilia bacterium]|nr:nitroreductase family protein [Thermoleophilia bacterium]
MSFADAVEGRHSVRRFRPDPVPRGDVRELVRLATRAANANNAQMWRFVAVDDRATLERMRAAIVTRLDEIAAWPEVVAAGESTATRAMAGSLTLFADAPLVVAVFGLPYASRGDRLLELRGLSRDEHDRLRQRPDLQSVGAAVQLLCTAAHTFGYGSCWMSAPVLAAESLERVLGEEPPARLVALVPIGRPAGRVRGTRRLPLDDVLRFV